MNNPRNGSSCLAPLKQDFISILLSGASTVRSFFVHAEFLSRLGLLFVLIFTVLVISKNCDTTGRSDLRRSSFLLPSCFLLL